MEIVKISVALVMNRMRRTHTGSASFCGYCQIWDWTVKF